MCADVTATVTGVLSEVGRYVYKLLLLCSHIVIFMGGDAVIKELFSTITRRFNMLSLFCTVKKMKTLVLEMAA